MKRAIGISALILLFSCGTTGSAWQKPPVWTLREDARVRASQRGENFSVSEFIKKIEKEENKKLAYVITPKGEAEISRYIRQLESRVMTLEQKLRDCNAQ